jgi:hypothetical protein
MEVTHYNHWAVYIDRFRWFNGRLFLLKEIQGTDAVLFLTFFKRIIFYRSTFRDEKRIISINPSFPAEW